MPENPGGESRVHKERLQSARRHVNNNSLDLAAINCFQVFGNATNMPVPLVGRCVADDGLERAAREHVERYARRLVYLLYGWFHGALNKKAGNRNGERDYRLLLRRISLRHFTQVLRYTDNAVQRLVKRGCHRFRTVAHFDQAAVDLEGQTCAPKRV